MAGEAINITSGYDDIDANKVLNKVGLLELSGQIKGYINTNMPQTYTLPTATTSTLGGVKVDGSTITINNGVISATASGGSSYTAGNGIDIDANNVIKRDAIDWGEPLFAVLSSGLVSNFSLGSGIGSYSSVANLAVALKQNKIAGTSAGFGYTSFSIKDLNDEMGTNYAGRKFNIDLTSNTPITNTYYSATSTTNINTGNRTTLALIIVDNEIWCVNGGVGGFRSLFGFNLSQILQLKTYNATNYTNSRLDQAIYQLDTAISSKQDAIIPSAPTTDGSYKLISTVASGTSTYSWETDSGGATYTAGTGISIENGVISLNLANAEEGEF